LRLASPTINVGDSRNGISELEETTTSVSIIEIDFSVGNIFIKAEWEITLFSFLFCEKENEVREKKKMKIVIRNL